MGFSAYVQYISNEFAIKSTYIFVFHQYFSSVSPFVFMLSAFVAHEIFIICVMKCQLYNFHISFIRRRFIRRALWLIFHGFSARIDDEMKNDNLIMSLRSNNKTVYLISNVYFLSSSRMYTHFVVYIFGVVIIYAYVWYLYRQLITEVIG